MIRQLDSNGPNYQQDLAKLHGTNPVTQVHIQEKVDHILAEVKSSGDTALLHYARLYDGVKVTEPAQLQVHSAQMEKALAQIDPELRAALTVAADRIRRYHQHQQDGALQGDYRFEDEYKNTFWQKTTPVDRVGLYVPGGKAFYPSTVLMNAIPAKVAGVQDICMAVPIGYTGVLSNTVLAAAFIAGVDRIFTMGGAQAIGAFAYGTQTVPAVDKIVGPGNTFVALAKRAVFGHVGLDMIAGPSETLIIADETLPVDAAVLDLFSQAEHDEAAQSIIVSTSPAYLQAIAQRIPELLQFQPRKAVIQVSLESRGALILVNSWAEAIAFANEMAPEHLELVFDGDEQAAAEVRHAGSVFIGRHTTESFGDYCSGTNHVLPTSGAARFSSPLGVHDFQKRTAFTQCSQVGAQALAPIAAVLARAEHLEAHAQAAESRLDE